MTRIISKTNKWVYNFARLEYSRENKKWTKNSLHFFSFFKGETKICCANNLSQPERKAFLYIKIIYIMIIFTFYMSGTMGVRFAIPLRPCKFQKISIKKKVLVSNIK